MTGDFPEPGQVFEYHYLWHWQKKRGETEGRKKRPCCMTIVVTNAHGQHVLFIAPITSKSPEKDRTAVAIPETEAKRAKLDAVIPLWIMVDEMNADILEASYILEDRTARGQFSSAFTDMVIHSAQEVRQAGKMRLSDRTK